MLLQFHVIITYFFHFPLYNIYITLYNTILNKYVALGFNKFYVNNFISCLTFLFVAHQYYTLTKSKTSLIVIK